jgi:predicted AAA+ superfamily ATPase
MRKWHNIRCKKCEIGTIFVVISVILCYNGLKQRDKNMERYAIRALENWKNSAGRKPLLLHGARQVGKTWLVRNFAVRHYHNIVELNFFNNDKLQDIFGSNITPGFLIRQLELLFDTKIDPPRTLLFFDEIQESQRAIDSLKTFNDLAPQYNIIAAGSFLGVMAGRQPVGQTDHLTLYPMSFCEFLEAQGFDKLAAIIQTRDTAMLTGAIIEMLETSLRQYFYVGGMPAAAQEFVNTGDWGNVREIQSELLDEYRRDFSKHIADQRTAAKIRMLWDSIPLHLFKENQKFVYKHVKVGGRAAEFEVAMQWLKDTGLIYKINKVETPKIPLAMHIKEDIFKLYMLDIGLFCAQAGIKPADILLQGVDIVDNMHGVLAEQFVLQELKTAGISPLFYWAREGSAIAEIDFITQGDSGGDIIPIEVKSARNTKAKSLKVYMADYKPRHAVRTSLNQYRVSDNLYDIPLYMISEFGNIIAEN